MGGTKVLSLELFNRTYWEQDAQFRFTVLQGPGAASLANGDVSRYLGQTRWDTSDLEPIEGTWAAHRERLERHEPLTDVILRRRFDDGSEGFMSVTGEPTYDAQGGFTVLMPRPPEDAPQSTALINSGLAP